MADRLVTPATTCTSTGVSKILENLYYGTGPKETIDLAKKWIKEHNCMFGSYVGGKWRTWKDGETLQYKTPGILDKLGSLSIPPAEAITEVLAVARDSQEQWSRSHLLRSRCMHSISKNLQKYQQLVTVVEALTSGIHVSSVRDIVVPYAVQSFSYYAGWAILKDVELKNWEPKKVVVVLLSEGTTPLFTVCRKICPALAMGNTVVVIPSPGASLSCMLLADICSLSGVPAGVFNVFPSNTSKLSALSAVPCRADKLVICDSLANDPLVNFPWHTLARQVSISVGHMITIVVFESSDLVSAASSVVEVLCNPIEEITRKVYVQEEIFEKFWDLLCFHLSKIRMGSYLDKCSDGTPSFCGSEVAIIAELLKDARREGAQVFKVAKPADSPSCACPCVVRNVQTSSRIVSELAKGPLAVVLPFRTAKESIALVNNCRYQQTVSIWSEKLPLAVEFARSVKAASVLINTHSQFDPAAGFGGSHRSGNYTDGGKQSLYDYLVSSCDLLSTDTEVEKMVRFEFVFPESAQEGVEKDDKLSTVDVTYQLYYGGTRKASESVSACPVVVGNQQIFLPVASAKDLQSAVMSAQSAQCGWGRRNGHDRAALLYNIAENILAKREEFQKILQQTDAMNLADAAQEVDLSVQALISWSAYCDKHGGSIQETSLYGIVATLNEPVGVIGITCPPSHPLLAFVTLFAAAIARGNTVVVVPSEKYPVPALNMYEVFDACGVPPGVVNIVAGKSTNLLQSMTSNYNIDALWTYVDVYDPKRKMFDVKTTPYQRIWLFSENCGWKDGLNVQSDVILYHSTRVKTLQMPGGEIFAN